MMQSSDRGFKALAVATVSRGSLPTIGSRAPSFNKTDDVVRRKAIADLIVSLEGGVEDAHVSISAAAASAKSRASGIRSSDRIREDTIRLLYNAGAESHCSKRRVIAPTDSIRQARLAGNLRDVVLGALRK